MFRNLIMWIRIARELQILEANQEKELEKQQIRVETINWLSENGMLKPGVS